ncbi:MAG TPA: saccharopine dehydrogenase C-terminal domain-containing protein [Actinomycetota bacterium]|nr:saccharopine dehydrogenase C-terminal domain-containing protein [Actinomycetota bacterium]
MPPGYGYAVLGAGRQGTAAAYDLAVRGDAREVVLCDVDPARAGASAERVNRLAGRDAARPEALDVEDHDAVVTVLEPLDACLAAVSYRLNEALTRAAIEARTHLADLGGSMDVVDAQLGMDRAARDAGVCVVPDCGEAPGLANNLCAYAATLLDEVEELRLYDGGIPVNPTPPWRYELTFSVDGLTNEYDGTTTFVRNGKPVEVTCLDPAEDELVDLGPPFGTLEALAAATASTLPFTLGTRLRTFTSKVLRWPGHGAQFRAFRDLGLFDEEPVEVNGAAVVPRQVYHALLDPRIRVPEGSPDVVLARVIADGARDGRASRAAVDLRVDPDPALGLTAMQRATGWHAAIVLRLMAAGLVEPGARPVEVAVDPRTMIAELRARGFEISEAVVPTGD